MDEFPIGTEGHFTYLSMEFDGEVAGYHPMYGCLVKVYRDTGHTQENHLHSGDNSDDGILRMDTRDYWYVGARDMKKTKPFNLIKPYDPTQGNEEDDV